MPKENYQAWSLDIDAFPKNDTIEKQIQFLLNFAILAPSGHNSQPWECRINSNTLFVYVNSERSLSQSDPKGRLLFISLGCFLENLLIAADFYGFEVSVENSFLSSTEAQEIFKITLNKTTEPKNDTSSLIFQIPKRHSNRYKYKIQSPENSFLSAAENLNSEDVKIIFVDKPDQKDKAAEIVQKAQVEVMESTAFRDELSHYVKSNFSSDKFGMPGFTLGIPAPVSIFASKLIKKINLSKVSAKQDLGLLSKFTPVLGIICIDDDNKISWLKAGRLLEHLWLLATSYDLVFSIWAAAVQIESSRKQLSEILNTTQKPVIIFRLGYPIVKSEASPRFSLTDILQ